MPGSLDGWLAEVERQPTAAHATALARVVRAALDTPFDPPGPRPAMYLDGFRSGSMRMRSRIERAFWSAMSERRTTTITGGNA